MQRTLKYLKHPLRYPEWGELLLAVMGLLQFISATIVVDELQFRRSLTLTVYFSPWGWSMIGFILLTMHVYALYLKEHGRGHWFRLFASGSSLAFWSHFIVSIFLNSVLFGGPLPVTLVPALGTPLLAGAVLYRLWRQY